MEYANIEQVKAQKLSNNSFFLQYPTKYIPQKIIDSEEAIYYLANKLDISLNGNIPKGINPAEPDRLMSVKDMPRAFVYKQRLEYEDLVHIYQHSSTDGFKIDDNIKIDNNNITIDNSIKIDNNITSTNCTFLPNCFKHIVGIDAEWKFNSPECSILQVYYCQIVR